MESLTHCQANRIRVGVRIVRRDTAGPGMESLTNCQANRIRVGVRIVRRDTAKPGMEILTTCQANKIRVGENSEKWNHSLAVKPTEPERE